MTESGEPAVATDAGEGRLPGWLSTYLTGLAMGSADAVPGVSGGTIALIAGIYDRLVGAIAAFEPGLLADAAEQRSLRPVVDLLVEMDVRFLVALGLGAFTGVVLVSRVLGFAYDEFAALTYAFFFGVIGASAVVLRGEVAIHERRALLAGVVGVAGAFVVAGASRAAVVRNPLLVLLAGGVVICAMILPGVSGSFLLLMIGLHQFLVDTLNGFVDGVLALASGGSLAAVRAPAVVLVAFSAGAGVGLLTFARVVQAALERDRATTMTFLVGLMVGSLRLPVERVAANVTPTAGGLGAVAVAAVVGGAVVVALDRYTGGVGYE